VRLGTAPKKIDNARLLVLQDCLRLGQIPGQLRILRVELVNLRVKSVSLFLELMRRLLHGFQLTTVFFQPDAIGFQSLRNAGLQNLLLVDAAFALDPLLLGTDRP
jgi:hypothetical protein